MMAQSFLKALSGGQFWWALWQYVILTQVCFSSAERPSQRLKVWG